jgi:monoterpene epsilon-lactone hydrolase
VGAEGGFGEAPRTNYRKEDIAMSEASTASLPPTSPEVRRFAEEVFAWAYPKPGETPEETLARTREGYDNMCPPPPPEVRVEEREVGGIPGRWITPPDAGPVVFVHFHGGGITIGSSKSHTEFGARLALGSGAQGFIVDFRRAPENPFPAAVEDGVAAYEGLLDDGHEPASLIFTGDSAGGGLMLGVALTIREKGLQLPAAIVGISTTADMTSSGSSYTERQHLDPVITLEMAQGMAANYSADHDRTDPLLSPVFADFHDFPPMLLLVGTSEILIDDTTKVAEAARRAGVSVEVIEEEGMIHVYPQLAWALPQGAVAIEQISAFIKRHTSEVR